MSSVPLNTPTDFMLQFFASCERHGLIQAFQWQEEQQDTTRENSTSLHRVCGYRRSRSFHDSAEDPRLVSTELDNTEPRFKVDERKLKPKPNPVPDPHQLLLNEIRSRPKLRPVREGKLVVESVGVRSTSDARPGQKDTTLKSPSKPVKKIIKPDFNLLLNNSFEESSDDDDRSSNHSPGTLDFRLRQHPRSDSMTTTPPPQHTWQRAVTRETLLREGQPGRGGSRLQRRHTITICEAPVEPQVDLPVVQEEDEEQQQPSPVRDSSSSSNNSRNVTLTRSSHSDNDLQGHMRQGQGLVRRASFDNRRAITSQASLGLTSIPELEDDGMLAARSKPQEHCPPPNLSPPCKGRSKTGLAMVGMKPSGAPYHPSTLRSSSDPACKPGAPYHPSTLRSSSDPTCKPGAPYHPSSLRSSSDPTCKPGAPYHPSSLRSNVVAAAAAAPKPSRIPDSMQHAVSSKPPQHASFNSSASLSSSMSPSSLSSASVLPHTSLDHSLSCQSPGYKKKFPRPNTSMPDTDSVKEERISRWRTAASAQTSRTENRENMAQQIPSPSPRRWAQTSRTHVREDMAREIPSLSPRRWASRVTDIEDDEIPPQPAGHKRLSLDAGMSLYYDEVLRQDGHDSLPSSPYLARDRKTSVGLDRGVSARMGFRRTKTPEEEEKIQRWRVLQEEDREARLSGQRGEAVRRTGVTRLPESTDVLQQRMAGEEERFERWRRLEEGSHSQSLLQQFNLRSPLASPSLKRHNTVSYCPEKQQYHGMDPSQQATWSSHQDQSADSVPLCDMPKRWQNPVECLSLTLEEVTHIRSVLTKAELESLMSHAALYQQVAKSKLCFTCKTTRFALFGEWGTKCKFCKRTVCSKCLRKMNVPADHFRNIPVYALSPTPFTQEMEEFIHQFIRSAPPPSVPATREPSPTRPSVSAGSAGSSKPLARSQSALHTTTTSTKVSVSSSLKGPLLAICCDCKSMVMEIIRATRASLTLLSSQSQNTGTLNVSARQYLANSKLASN